MENEEGGNPSQMSIDYLSEEHEEWLANPEAYKERKLIEGGFKPSKEEEWDDAEQVSEKRQSRSLSIAIMVLISGGSIIATIYRRLTEDEG